MSFLKRAVSTVVTSPLTSPLGTPVLHLTQYALSLHRREVVSFDQRAERSHAEGFVLTMFKPIICE